ncbi:hypothetical protein [Haladaptatus sp. R4]|uniref:hypothetical protein n=1 Tax=Haladaptatus sp. R4 TaxID=1679489 RepID=UPI000A541CF4|nr:hypothetical protein [Haladaptatus sp. R4]
MRHAHLVLTVDAETRDRIEADLTDETVEEWLLDAVERKLDATRSTNTSMTVESDGSAVRFRVSSLAAKATCYRKRQN